MEEINLFAGCIKGILEKYADPIIKGIVNLGKDEWEKFKVDFEIAFIEYLKNSMDKYGKIKTILYRTEPKYIYDFFECPNLQKEKGNVIKGDSIDNVLDISHFVIIQGSGGIGKSTFLKHLFMDEVSKKGWIPVFIELKDINSINGDYEISDFIFQRLYDLGSTLKKEYIEYALRSGCFTFLLDGYDEIATDKKDVFFRKLDSFCDRFSDNYFVISSRPYSEFVEFQRFSVLTLCKLSKEQALSLVSKIEFENEIKQRFITALDERLYERHKSFASNPLLLNIMLLTFDNYAEIPEKLHLFYANAFETLYSKHDATKAGYRRELRCSLSYDSFKKVFAYFCFVTYFQGKIEFTYDEILATLKKISNTVVKFEPADYTFDLVNSICVLYKDGLTYKFTHRSFQEYFTAIFLKELSDPNMQKMGVDLAKKDFFKASNDSVFSMLHDMAEPRFEQNILLPLVIDFEKECDNEKKYDFYFDELSPVISFRHFGANKELQLVLYHDFEGEHVHFLFTMALSYIERTTERNTRVKVAEEKLRKFMVEKRNYKHNIRINSVEYRDDHEVYALIKDTWVGEVLYIMANMRERLEQKRRDEELDLSCLIIE